jgi:hypothetical protein
VAGVEDALCSYCDGGLDANAVQGDGVDMRIVGGDEQDLLGTFEGVAQRGRVLVGALPYSHSAVAEVLCLDGVADADADLFWGQTLEEVFDSGAVEGASGSGDNHHDLFLRGRIAVLGAALVVE